MSDGLGDARRAMRQGEAGEALVHLWNAFEQARGTNDAETLGRIAALAQQVEAEGDEGERAEAERLLEEIRDEAGLVTEEPDEEDEAWVLPGGGSACETGPGRRPEPPTEPGGEAEEVEEGEEPRSRGRVALGWLIPLAIFLFLTLRDVLT
jgi:hypothetical protein